MQAGLGIDVVYVRDFGRRDSFCGSGAQGTAASPRIAHLSRSLRPLLPLPSPGALFIRIPPSSNSSGRSRPRRPSDSDLSVPLPNPTANLAISSVMRPNSRLVETLPRPSFSASCWSSARIVCCLEERDREARDGERDSVARRLTLLSSSSLNRSFGRPRRGVASTADLPRKFAASSNSAELGRRRDVGVGGVVRMPVRV